MEGGRRSLCGGCPGAARARVFAAFRDAAANAVSLEAASASSQSRVAPGRVGTHREQLSGRHKSGRLKLRVPAGGLAETSARSGSGPADGSRARQGRDDFGSEPKYPSCRSPSVPGRRLGAWEHSSAKNNVTTCTRFARVLFLVASQNASKYARSSVPTTARAPHRSPFPHLTSHEQARRITMRVHAGRRLPTPQMISNKLLAALALLAQHAAALDGVSGTTSRRLDDLCAPASTSAARRAPRTASHATTRRSPPPPPPSSTEAPTAAPTVPGFIPYDGDYSLATTQNHSCFGDATCPSAFQLGGGIKSSINASSIFLPNGERPRPSRRLQSTTAVSMASSPLPHAVNAVDASSRESTAAASRRSRPAQASSNSRWPLLLLPRKMPRRASCPSP